MIFSKKIYINDKPLILTTDKGDYLAKNPEAEAYMVMSGANKENILSAISQLDKPTLDGIMIEGESEEIIEKQLSKLFRPITAAGGIAYNEDNAILMIYRRGKWDLPKGKLDEGEGIEECALREVMEETGLEHLTITEKIIDTYHIYHQNNEQFLKLTVWYKMTGTKADKLLPQKEENIIEARWVAQKDLAPFASRTYEAIREVLHLAGMRW